MDINYLEQKIKTLEKACKLLDEEFVSNMMKAEEKNDVYYVGKSSALKLKSTGNKAEIKSLEERLILHEKQKKLKF